MPAITRRSLPSEWNLPGLPPLLQRIYAARGVTSAGDLELGLGALIPYQQMKGIADAVELLIPVVTEGRRLRVVGDFESPDFLLSFKHFFGNFKNIIYVTLGMGSTGKCHPQQFHA